jgi:putative transposase
MAPQPIILSVRRAAQRRIAHLARKTRHKTVYRRCQIILQLAKRARPEEIARGLACDVSTVYRTRQAFEQIGEASLVPKQSPGRPPTITAEDERRLDQAIEHEPRTQQQNFSNWTMRNLRHYLRWNVHAVTVWRHVRRLGWRWRRPVPRVASPDRRYAAKDRYLRRLRQQARRGLIHLYYADEMDVALLPTISGRWMRQGHQTQVDTPGQNAKQYVLGAVNYITGRLIWLSWVHKNNAGFRQLLEQLIKVHSHLTRKIVVVVDNFRIHKALAVHTWLENHRPRLRLYFLPTYSPQLNPIERVWRHCRRNVTDNFYFKTMTRLMNALKAFLTDLANSPKVILGIVA